MGDTTRGQIAVPFNFNVNLIDRIPMVYDYIYENRTSNDYLLAGEGMGYGMLSALYQGFQGKEASPHTRTLPSGDTAYLNYAKPYFKELKMDISTQVINGFSVLEPRSLGVLNQLSPSGSFLQNSAAGTRDIQIYNGVPHLRLFNIEGSDLNSRCAYLYNLQKNSSYNFVPVGFFNQGLNYGTSSSIIEFTTAYQEYYSNKTFGLGRMEYVDPGTFLSLVKQSGQGTVVS